MPIIPKFIRDKLPGAQPDTGAPSGFRPITPPKQNQTDYGAVDFAIGNPVVAQHGDGAGEVKATGTSKKGPGRAHPAKQVLTEREEASLPTVPNGTKGTVQGVMGKYMIVQVEGIGAWEFWKEDWTNMAPPDVSTRRWGKVTITAADLDDRVVVTAADDEDLLCLSRDGHQVYKGSYKGKSIWIGSKEQVQHGSYPANRRQKRERRWHVKIDGEPVGDTRTFPEAKALVLATLA